jgi:hypothetical protein
VPARWFVLGLKNAGCGIAKFPGIRFRRSHGLNVNMYGIDGSGGFGLPQRPSESEWVIFRGGVDDVIYPGEVRKITKLWQGGENVGDFGEQQPGPIGPAGPRARWNFKSVDLQCEISCEGAQSEVVQTHLPEESAPWP